jgi:hypothetical protein
MRSDELRRALGRRVTARVAGRGVTPPDVEAAVARVVAALESEATPGSRVESGTAPAAPMIVAFTATRPDLASLVRALLREAGATDAQLGFAQAGRHAAVTARVAASARSAVRRAAAAAEVSVAFAGADGSDVA